MARKPSGSSLELERSMNMQVRVLTFEENLRHSRVIDELDDIRRTNSFNLNKWNKDMQISFSKKRMKILKLNNLEAVKTELEKLAKEIDDFNTIFFRKRKEIDDLEVEYEKLDDKNHDWLLEYAVSCREKLRIENSQLEKQLIEENLHKKKGE